MTWRLSLWRHNSPRDFRLKTFCRSIVTLRRGARRFGSGSRWSGFSPERSNGESPSSVTPIMTSSGVWRCEVVGWSTWLGWGRVKNPTKKLNSYLHNRFGGLHRGFPHPWPPYPIWGHGAIPPGTSALILQNPSIDLNWRVILWRHRPPLWYN